MSDHITLDEEITGVVDTFEEITKYKILRDNSNKLYLILKSIAAGFNKIRDIVVTLKNRFNPAFCSEEDLETIMKITGISRIESKPSSVQVMIENQGDSDALMPPGVYWFTSTSGDIFEAAKEKALTVHAHETTSFLFFSEMKGSFHVMDQDNISVALKSGVPIDSNITFRTLDNSLMLGNAEESWTDVRKRLITSEDRQDTLKEMEIEIRNLPTIYECNLIFNPGVSDEVLEDQTTLPAKTLLIILTGIATPEIAEIVASKTLYSTLKVTESQVVYYYNDLFIDGRFPVYYKNHSIFEYYLAISFIFYPQEISLENAKDSLSAAYSHLKVNVHQKDRITEKDMYSLSKDTEGIVIIKIFLQKIVNGEKKTVRVLDVPKMAIPRLADIDYYVEDSIGG